MNTLTLMELAATKVRLVELENRIKSLQAYPLNNRFNLQVRILGKQVARLQEYQQELEGRLGYTELRKALGQLLDICESEFPQDQWAQYYMPIITARRLLGRDQ